MNSQPLFNKEKKFHTKNYIIKISLYLKNKKQSILIRERYIIYTNEFMIIVVRLEKQSKIWKLKISPETCKKKKNTIFISNLRFSNQALYSINELNF